MADKAKENAVFVDAQLDIQDSPLLKRAIDEELNGQKKEKELTDAEIRQFFRTSGGTRTERWAEAEAKAREARKICECGESNGSGTCGDNKQDS